jgi:hypothetical protein
VGEVVDAAGESGNYRSGKPDDTKVFHYLGK